MNKDETLQKTVFNSPSAKRLIEFGFVRGVCPPNNFLVSDYRTDNKQDVSITCVGVPRVELNES